MYIKTTEKYPIIAIINQLIRKLDFCKYFLQNLEWQNIFCELGSQDREFYTALPVVAVASELAIVNTGFFLLSLCSLLFTQGVPGS